MSKQYIDQIRQNTCYPTFRGVVKIGLIAGYIAGAVIVIACIILSDSRIDMFFFGPILGGLVILLARVFNEASLMLADIADSTIETASRKQQS